MRVDLTMAQIQNLIEFYDLVEEAELENPDRENENKTERITLRVTKSEKQQIKEKANDLKLKMSQYLRMMALAEFEGFATGKPKERSKAQKRKDVSKEFTPAQIAVTQELRLVFSTSAELGENGFIKPSSIKTQFKEKVIDVKQLKHKEVEASKRMMERENLLHPPMAPIEE